MWYLNKNNNAINLKHIISTKIIEKENKIKILTSDNRVVLEVFDDLKEAQEFVENFINILNKNEGIKMRWYYNKDNVAINLSQIVMLKAREYIHNTYYVYAYDVYTKYVLEKFATLEEANNFIKAIVSALNGERIDNKLGYAFNW